MSTFKMPSSYYDPPEELLWIIGCNDCEEIFQSESNADDLKNIEICPCCGSDSITTYQDYV